MPDMENLVRLWQTDPTDGDAPADSISSLDPQGLVNQQFPTVSATFIAVKAVGITAAILFGVLLCLMVPLAFVRTSLGYSMATLGTATVAFGYAYLVMMTFRVEGIVISQEDMKEVFGFVIQESARISLSVVWPIMAMGCAFLLGELLRETTPAIDEKTPPVKGWDRRYIATTLIMLQIFPIALAPLILFDDNTWAPITAAVWQGLILLAFFEPLWKVAFKNKILLICLHISGALLLARLAYLGFELSDLVYNDGPGPILIFAFSPLWFLALAITLCVAAAWGLDWKKMPDASGTTRSHTQLCGFTL